jgi:hypothetical protein
MLALFIQSQAKEIGASGHLLANTIPMNSSTTELPTKASRRCIKAINNLRMEGITRRGKGSINMATPSMSSFPDHGNPKI